MFIWILVEWNNSLWFSITKTQKTYKSCFLFIGLSFIYYVCKACISMYSCYYLNFGKATFSHNKRRLFPIMERNKVSLFGFLYEKIMLCWQIFVIGNFNKGKYSTHQLERSMTRGVSGSENISLPLIWSAVLIFHNRISADCLSHSVITLRI